MIEVNNVNVFNFDGAFHGLRNPMNSWEKSDSDNSIYPYNIGPNDMKLAQRMIGGGTEESKFMRQIFVTMDINAPFFW